jgi:hypothetical protein
MGDWIERKTAALISNAKRNGYLSEVVADARTFAAQGYAWDVALDIASAYWCNNGLGYVSPPVK